MSYPLSKKKKIKNKKIKIGPSSISLLRILQALIMYQWLKEETGKLVQINLEYTETG